MQVPVQILDTDVVHVQVVAGRDGANPVENIFRRRGPRDGVDHNVCVRKQAMHSAGHLVGNLAGALESYVARQPDRDIRKVAVAGTADAHTVHFEQALHTLQGSDDLATRANRSGVEKRVYGATRQARADENDNTGHEESGDWDSLNQPGNVGASAERYQRKSKGDDSARPDVGRGTKPVRLQSLAVVLCRDAA